MKKNGKSMPEAEPRPPSRRDPLSKGLILVVEDDLDISKMLRIDLDSQGYETHLTKQGKEVLEICIQNMPDAVILDPNLPDISGGEVYKELRSNPKTKHIPVVFIPEDSEEAHQAFMGLKLGKKDKVITQPFDIEELKRYIEGVIPKNPDAPGTVLWKSDKG
jgi:two-component system, OmpR family, phosphate regulon response regulator PhoB